MKSILLSIVSLALPLLANASESPSSCSDLGGGMMTVHACDISEDYQARASLAQLPASVQICANGDYIEVIEIGFDGGVQLSRESSVSSANGSLLITDDLHIDLPTATQGSSVETSISNTKASARYNCKRQN